MAISKVKDLIEHLQRYYQEDEYLAYTLYSEKDVKNVLQYDYPDITANPAEVWKEVIGEADGAIGTAQGDINNYLKSAIDELLECEMCGEVHTPVCSDEDEEANA